MIAAKVKIPGEVSQSVVQFAMRVRGSDRERSMSASAIMQQLTSGPK
jgi:hypothetical protein